MKQREVRLRDVRCLLYLKRKRILNIKQVKPEHRKDLYKILDGEKLT